MTSVHKVSVPLMFVSGYVYRILRQEARGAGMRWTAILVLKDLELLGPLSQQALADIEQVSRPTMTVLLHEMEDLGWVKRSVDSTNRSANLIRITVKGTKALRAAGTRFVARIQAALEGLSARDSRSLEQGVTALAGMWMDGIRTRRATGTGGAGPRGTAGRPARRAARYRAA
jgi:DNA-binding MarR family transcriptional regulator